MTATSMTAGRRTLLLLATAVLALPLSAMTATAAWAGPPGCRHDTTGFGQASNGALFAKGEASCNTRKYRVLYVEIKQDLRARPDPVAVKGSVAGSSPYYRKTISGCDNRNNSIYYGRTFFGGYTDYSDTTHRRYQVC